MNADAFRHVYEYHFAENRNLWDAYVSQLSDDQFAHSSPYSHGSVREQIIHLINVDHAWFSDLRKDEPVELPEQFADRERIREAWDAVEQRMRDYLAGLHDAMVFEKPFAEGEDKDLILWQVLLHVINHGTDHRAQILRMLHDLGVSTTAQDYIFYAYRHP